MRMMRVNFSSPMHDKVLVLDCGGQYAHLVASRIRRLGVFSEIHDPATLTPDMVADPSVKGIIFSGGPGSVYVTESPTTDPAVFDVGKPILGMCYGHQLVAQSLGGAVGGAQVPEFGATKVQIVAPDCPLFEGVPEESIFWMSHRDEVKQLPEGFVHTAQTADCHVAGMWHPERTIFSVQFHPEVSHSEYGGRVLDNFLHICQATRSWTMELFLQEETKKLKEKIGNRNVVLFVSGGVDSSVCLALLSNVLGAERVRGLFIDTGLLRKGEREQVEQSLKAVGADLTVLDESELFLGRLAGIAEPEKKRHIIGQTFLDVQARYFAEQKLGDNWVLAQGTIYPDTIETGATKNSSTIKTHHNRVPAVEAMIREGKVVEPIADLYKDEVRALGELLGLPHDMVWRHPFPGPGLGVRILCSDAGEVGELIPREEGYAILPIRSVGVQGDNRTYAHPGLLSGRYFDHVHEFEELCARATALVNRTKEINRMLIPVAMQDDMPPKHVARPTSFITQERIDRLQKADAIVRDLMHKHGVHTKVWQFPVVLCPLIFNQLGKETIILRPIDSIDVMSVSVPNLPQAFYEAVASEILKDKDISAVLLDLTSKPPGTVEWE